MPQHLLLGHAVRQPRPQRRHAPSSKGESGPDDAPSDALQRRVDHLLGAELRDRWHREQRLAWAGVMEIARLLPPRHNREMLDRHGLSLMSLSLLGHIDEHAGQPLHARDLAREVDLSPGKVSRHLSDLEAAGLLSRSKTAQDARSLDVELTKAGRDRLAEARRTAVEIVERDFLRFVTPEETVVVARVAERILAAFGS